MTRATVLTRARSGVGHGCAYVLGKGGMNPESATPWGEKIECDCSGFALWTVHLHRLVWLDTTRIVQIARDLARIFVQIPWSDAKPADLIVYGDRIGTDRKEHQGHMGVISEVTHGPTRVIHCSAGNWKRTGDAVQETGPEAWTMNQGSIVVRAYNVED
jgi:cell wall-associated NlpC family hydrolase